MKTMEKSKIKPKCNVKECDRPQFTMGWCAAHDRQVRRNGRITHAIIQPPFKGRKKK